MRPLVRMRSATLTSAYYISKSELKGDSWQELARTPQLVSVNFFLKVRFDKSLHRV
jgi:hypothetical protein